MAERVRVGEEPKSSGGDPNILQLSGANKIRLVDEDMLKWKQHTVRYVVGVDMDPGSSTAGQPVFDEDKTPEFIVCPGPKLCPLCRKPTDTMGKQNFPVSKRRAANVWDYTSNSIKALIGGPSIFDEFTETRDVGIDPLSCDWIIHKTGKGISTSYKMVRANPTAFEFASQVTPDRLVNLDKYGDEHSPEKIFEILEKCGWDYDSMQTQEFTPDQALAYVIPFGKHKGMTVEQILAQDPDYAEWFHGKGLGDEEFMNPNWLAIHVALEDRGMVASLESLMDSATTSAAAAHEQPVAATEQPASTPQPTAQTGMVTMLDKDGVPTEVPEAAVEALLAAGYTRPAEPEPEPPAEPTFPITMEKDGTQIPVADASAMVALEGLGFVRVEPAATEPEADPEPEPEETAPSRVVPAKEPVHVTIGGSTLPMAFDAALTVLRSGTEVEFQDSEVTEYALMLVATGGEPPSEIAAPAQSSAEAAMHAEGQDPQPGADPDKPFTCSLCDWAGKTKGSLTQHVKREHPDAVEEPAATATTTTPPAGATVTGDDPARRVKELLAKLPADEKDYKVILKLFEEAAGGKRDLNDFSPEEIAKLEATLEAKVGG